MNKVGKAKAQAAVLQPKFKLRVEPDKREAQTLREMDRELDYWEEEEYNECEETET